MSPHDFHGAMPGHTARAKVRACVCSWLILVVSLVAPGRVEARAQARGGAPLDQPGVTPAEIQRMFEAYALVQAQEQLKLSDEKYPQFLVKFKALQDARRRTQQDRNRLLQELRRFANDGGADARIKEQLKMLDDLDVRARGDLQKAYDAVDSVLDARQQAKFRLFEEQMERRKIELLIRARQANRQQKRNP